MNSIEIHPLEESVIEAIWIQWRSLGSLIDAGRIARTVIDPEALLLISLTLYHRERRLWDILASWAKNGSKLFSVQRVKNLQTKYPELARERLAEFANRARTEGNDFRWRSLAGDSSGPASRNQDLWEAYPRVWHPPALVLRLRLGLGVGIVPDLLSFLIARRGEWTSASLIAQATAYSVYSIRRVADDLASAQLIEKTHTKPVHYRAEIKAWGGLLGTGDQLPEWHFWNHVYSFAAMLLDANERSDWDGHSPYMLSTKLRDLVEEHQDGFKLNRIELPEPGKFIGEEYLPAFFAMINNLAEWIKNEV